MTNQGFGGPGWTYFDLGGPRPGGTRVEVLSGSAAPSVRLCLLLSVFSFLALLLLKLLLLLLPRIGS